jgi:hypothetical protein
VVSRCLSATGIRFSVILYPPGSWALLTVGLPARRRTPTGIPRSARTSCDRGGRPLYPGDNGAHPDRWRLTAGIRRFSAASPCTPQPSHQAGVRITRHQRGFKQFARPVFPSLWPPGWIERPLGSPPGFAPRRPGADNARRGGDRPSSTDLELPAQLTSVDLQSGSSLNACDIASHVAIAIARRCADRMIKALADASLCRRGTNRQSRSGRSNALRRAA